MESARAIAVVAGPLPEDQGSFDELHAGLAPSFELTETAEALSGEDLVLAWVDEPQTVLGA